MDALTHLVPTALLIVGSVSLAACGGDDSDGGEKASNDPTADSAAALCVQAINEHRASLGLPAYARWRDAEPCADQEASSDSGTKQAHGAFGKCQEHAQNECPGWPGPADKMIGSCLDMMWNEGPGDFAQHGHYVNMSSTTYTKVACGFHLLPDGSVWAVQDFL